ncbi:MAG: Gfo/Idh/MocA family oxidoreductase [Chloroflexota bacterium]|nr:Gfo/Idh/MocA family oxidoreductase [Chloroflexota bacterium]
MPDSLRAVLVGCGGISAAWLEAAANLEVLQLVGLVDIVEAAAQNRAREYALGNAVTGSDLGAVLDATAPDIVFNCTVPEAHTGVTIEALQHGCHVLSEKPLADSLENAQRTIDTAQQTGKTFAVMQNRRYIEPIRRLRGFLDTGRLGGLTTVTTDFYIGAHFGGFRDHMPHVLLLDMAIHTFDATRLLTGADPVSVYCHEWNPTGSWYDRDASAIAIFEMTSGITYTYRGSWCAEGLPTSWEGEWRIVGSQGTATWDGGVDLRAQVIAETGGFHSTLDDVDLSTPAQTAKVGGHAGVIADFVRCVRIGEIPETVCTDNIRSLAMVLGAIESAETGQRVAVTW